VNRTLEQALDAEGAAQTVNFATDDTAEAIRAFLDKRTPTFRGR
jgi:2-(1,2-epoxy-1,2-dihydrophenyl)acetyl-CoA isomerase